MGIVQPDVALLLQEHPEIFTVSSTAIHLNNKYGSCEERTEIMKVFLNGLMEAGHLNRALKGWRNEVRRIISGLTRFTCVQIYCGPSPLPKKSIQTQPLTCTRSMQAYSISKHRVQYPKERVIKNAPDEFACVHELNKLAI